MGPSNSPDTMRALRAHSRGGPEVLVYESAPTPKPAANQVLVAVNAASVTFSELTWDETWERDGHSRLPVIPSHEFVGEVVEPGADVTAWRPGDIVYGLIPFDQDGAAAEYLAIDGSILARAPRSIGPVETAAVPLAALTAWQAFVDHSDLRAGQRVLIHGAAGGVGIFAVQLARHFGAEVTVTARDKDAEFLRGLGADRVIDFETESFEDARPFDLVVDAIGGEVLDRSYGAVRPGGTLVTLNTPPSQQRAAQLGITATFFIVSPDPAELSAIADLIDHNKLRVVVAASYPLSEGRRAFESGEQHGRPPGKTVLSVRA